MNNFGIVFSGQGYQHAGIGKNVYLNSKSARRVFDEASDLLDYDIAKICFSDDRNQLMDLEYTQPAIFTQSFALYKALSERIDNIPIVMAGHSLGEYTALTAGGWLNFSDSLRIVSIRGKLMKKCAGNQQGGMLALHDLDIRTIKSYCMEVSNITNAFIDIANINAKGQVALSGENTAIDFMIKLCQKNSVRYTKLNVVGAFHSPLMLEASKEFAAILGEAEFFEGQIPVFSNVTGEIYEYDTVKEVLANQINSPVLWCIIMGNMIKMHVDLVVECGSKGTLKNFFNMDYPKIKVYAMENKKDQKAIDSIVFNKEDIATVCYRIACCTKNDSEYSAEFENTVMIAQQLRNKSYGNDRISVDEAITMLSKILQVKKVPIEEIDGYINEIRSRYTM